MELIKCPVCGEMYSPSYRRCPFCEEEGEPERISYRPHGTRRAMDNKRRRARSARGALVAVLVLVLALLSWYIFSDKIMARIVPDTPTPAPNQNLADDPVIHDPFYDPNAETDPTPGTNTEPDPVDDPPETADPQISAAVLQGARLNRTDFTLNAAGETFKMEIYGVDVAPRWSSDDENVAAIAEDGTVRAVGGGTTLVKANYTTEEGAQSIDCIVRVKGAAYTPATSVTPTQPSVPAENTTPSEPTTPATPSDVDVSNARLSNTDFTAKVGEKVQLRVKNTEAPVTWSIDNSSIATITDSGLITGVARGTTKAYAKVGDRTLECIVRIQN